MLAFCDPAKLGILPTSVSSGFENLSLSWDFQFSEMKQDERRSTAITVNGSGDSSGNETTVSLIVGGKTLYLFNLYDPENPIELAFQSR